MRELTNNEVELVSGGYVSPYSCYEVNVVSGVSGYSNYGSKIVQVPVWHIGVGGKLTTVAMDYY